MAKTIYSQGGKIEYGVKEYVVDTEEDKEALTPKCTRLKTKCYVIESQQWYILDSSDNWVPFVEAGGSGGDTPYGKKFVVTFTADVSATFWTADKTYEVTAKAIDDKKEVIFVISQTGLSAVCSSITKHNGFNNIAANFVTYDGGVTKLDTLIWEENGGISLVSHALT